MSEVSSFERNRQYAEAIRYNVLDFLKRCNENATFKEFGPIETEKYAVFGAQTDRELVLVLASSVYVGIIYAARVDAGVHFIDGTIVDGHLLKLRVGCRIGQSWDTHEEVLNLAGNPPELWQPGDPT